MDTLPEMETTEIVLASARAAGFTPTPKQRKDWVRAGLLPKHVNRDGFGRNVGGSVVFYPPGTGELLTAICRHSKPKKLIPQLAMLVWWDGHTLPNAKLVRSALNRTLDDWERLTMPWVSLDDVTADDWIKLDRQLASRLPASFRSVRDLAEKDLFRRVTATLLNVAAGGFDAFHPYPPATGDEVRGDFEAGLSVDQAAWITRGLADVLPQLSVTLNPATLRGVLDDSTPADLELARDEVRDLVSLIDDTRHLTLWFGDDVGKPFAHLDAGSLSSGNLAMMTLFWLSASRRPAIRRQYRELLPLARQLSELRRQLDSVRTTDTQKPPRARQRSGGTTHGEETSTCTRSLSPPQKSSFHEAESLS